MGTFEVRHEPDGVHYIEYQENGWIRHFKEYNDGTTEEWFEHEI